ncbi:Fe-S cluster assembly ATPase SufC [Candidatus Marinamargulisbacteria bacterium SCGC AG-343-K17]|nr:Fe-S cluster assembly ATPase SufC [Candidatus Marinamargulisbacteria bacterium SCGC AG-343-K17]
MLKINNLHATLAEENLEIVKGLNLELEKGKVHAIMGPNGSGKSTLSKIIAGDENYEITKGTITFNGTDIDELDATQRALSGLFLAFQYPVEIPGVNNAEFLRMAYNAKQKHQGKDEVDPLAFNDILKNKIKDLNIPEEFLDRELNFGFSGGEKKRNEILQLAVLNPSVAILDETDSGLDIDALKQVSESVNKLKSNDNTFLIITHYQRLLDYIEPDYVHIMIDGKIVETGNKELAKELDKKGYDHLLKTI